MKKLLLLLCFLFLFFASNAQYPVTQFIGADSTLVKSRGGLQGRFAPIPFTDTAQANTSRIRQYPGALIYTSGVDKYWYRNSTMTGWVEFTSSGGSTVNIYNSNGTLSSERTVDGDGNGIQFNSFRWFAVGADSVQFSLNSNVFRVFGLPETQDTSTYKPLVINPITGRVLHSSYWYGGGGGAGTDTISLSNRINQKLNISDTANKWVTAVRRSNDSVFYQKGGSWTFAYKDSTGGSSDGYVDSVRFNSTTNILTVYQNTASDQSVYLPPSYLNFDSSYTPLGGMRNDSTGIIKSVRIRRNNVTVTPTQIGDSAMYWDISVPTTYIDSIRRERLY
jgi:hypothetical protein